jgi:hypothetical protein
MGEGQTADPYGFPHIPQTHLIPVQKWRMNCIQKIPMPEGEGLEATTQDTMPDVVIYERSGECPVERHARFRASVNPPTK